MGLMEGTVEVYWLWRADGEGAALHTCDVKKHHDSVNTLSAVAILDAVRNSAELVYSQDGNDEQPPEELRTTSGKSNILHFIIVSLQNST